MIECNACGKVFDEERNSAQNPYMFCSDKCDLKDMDTGDTDES